MRMPDFPPEGRFREFTLEFTSAGGREDVMVAWAVGRMSARNRLVEWTQPKVPLEVAVLKPEEEVEGGQKREEPPSGLLSFDELKGMEVRLAGRMPIVEMRERESKLFERPYREVYKAGKGYFSLCEEGEPKAVIVVAKGLGKTAERNIPLVGERLRAGLQKVTGARFFIYRERSSKPRTVEIGLTERAKEVRLPLEGLNRDGFVIRVTPERLFIAGATPSGTRFGVYYFLNHYLGVREYHPDELFYSAPYGRTLRLPVGELREEPDFLLRSFSSGGFYHRESGKSSIAWFNYNGLQYHTDEFPHPYGFHHNMARIFERHLRMRARKEAEELLKDVPKPEEMTLETEEEVEGEVKKKPRKEPLFEVFAHLLKGLTEKGKRKRLKSLLSRESGWQPCFTSSETVKICFESAKEAFERAPELRGFSLGYNDGSAGYCSCERCRKMMEGEEQVLVNYYKYWNYSATYGWLLNEVAERVEKEFRGG